jgi:hypothetical protein
MSGAWLLEEAGFDVVGVASDAQELLALVRERTLDNRRRPSIHHACSPSCE